jgi:hypothetical protein
LLAAVTAVAATATACTHDTRSATTSTASTTSTSTAAASGPRLRIVRTPASWHVEYRLEEGGKVSTDKVWVRRPFDSVLETWDGAPPGTALQVSQVATLARRSSGQVTLEVPPGVPASDVRLQPVLDDALAHGVLVPLGRKTVAGRACQVYRSGQLLSAPVLRKPTAADHGESCVDEAGLVLEEVLTADGKRLSRRVAVSVEEDPAAGVGDDRFPVRERTVDVRQGGGRVRRLVPDSRPPGEFFSLDAPPDGFTHEGRYSVVPPQPENFSDDDPSGAGKRRAGVVDVWVRGVDVLVVDQGGTLGGYPPYAPDDAAPTVDLGPTLGHGEVVLSALEPAVRTILPGGRYVRVAGTLPPAELAAVARRLTSGPGGELDFADD